MSKFAIGRTERSQQVGIPSRLLAIAACLGAMIAVGLVGAGGVAAQSQCPFEIIQGCRCPSDCNSDRCEVTCFVVGQDRRGNCAYNCPIQCPCEGIACSGRSFWQVLASGIAVNANAAVVEKPANKFKEVENADGKFVIVPKEEIEKLSAQSAGIGISVVKSSSGSVVVGRVVSDGPAGKAGIAAGDEIISVDGRKTDGLPITTITQWLRGRPATLVVLKVKSKDGETRKFSFNRIELSTVGAAEKKKPAITIKNFTLTELKSKSCPPETGGCHLLSQDRDDCSYTCKKGD